MRILFSLISHIFIFAVGFVLGIYTLPILVQPPAPSQQELKSVVAEASLKGEFRRDRADSDFLHWGEGKVSLSEHALAFQGELAPGPDYKAYLSPVFVETEVEFFKHQNSMIQVGDVKSFTGFMLPVDDSVDIHKYRNVVIWCESFGQYITSARLN